jgi:heme/copper-type cytochrome/quinol oxidase subunit 4
MSGFLAGVGGWVAMLFAALVIAIVLGGFVWYLSVALL